jgi:hypothetical protein
MVEIILQTIQLVLPEAVAGAVLPVLTELHQSEEPAALGFNHQYQVLQLIMQVEAAVLLELQLHKD